MVKKYNQFLNELVEDGVGEPEVVKLHLSDKMIKFLTPLRKEYKIADLFLKLGEGVNKADLSKDPANYFELEDDGDYVSYLKSRYFPDGDFWATKRRIKQKTGKVLRDTFSEDFSKANIKDTDVETYLAKLAAIKAKKGVQILEWRGKDLLRAYNYTEECAKDFGYTCANFHQRKNNFGGHAEPTLAQYDVYVKNPENCGVVVIMENGKVMYRRSFQQGANLIDGGKFKKGDLATVYGNGYGVAGRGGKFDKLVTDYLINKYNAASMGGGNFVIKMETRFAEYCPFDSMNVCFEYNLLSDGYGGRNQSLEKEGYPKNLRWVGTYHAHCPKDLVNRRIKEEKGELEPEPMPEVPPPPPPPRPFLPGEKVVYVRQPKAAKAPKAGKAKDEEVVAEKPDYFGKTAVFVETREDGKYRIRWDETGKLFACNPKNIKHVEEEKK